MGSWCGRGTGRLEPRLAFFKSAPAAIAGAIAMMFLMILLRVVAEAVRDKNNDLRPPVLALVWTVVLLFIGFCGLTFSSIAFGNPGNFRSWLALSPTGRFWVSPEDESRETFGVLSALFIGPGIRFLLVKALAHAPLESLKRAGVDSNGVYPCNA